MRGEEASCPPSSMALCEPLMLSQSSGERLYRHTLQVTSCIISSFLYPRVAAHDTGKKDIFLWYELMLEFLQAEGSVISGSFGPPQSKLSYSSREHTRLLANSPLLPQSRSSLGLLFFFFLSFKKLFNFFF